MEIDELRELGYRKFFIGIGSKSVLLLRDVCFMVGKNRELKDEAAIGRINVVSADGTPLMPCKSAKALKLLRYSTAFWEQGEDGEYRLRLRFDPKSPIVRPPENVKTVVNLNSSYLAKVKEEAKRKQVWFRNLCQCDRAIVDLTIKCVDKPKSPRLIDALARIVVRVKAALVSPLRRLMGQVSRPLAMKLSRMAVRWGYKAAEEWAEDEGFIRYLTVMDRAFQSLASNMRL